MNKLQNIQKHFYWLSGILLGLSYLSFSDFHQGPLACIALVPFLMSIQNENSFGRFSFKMLVVYSLTIIIGFWWTGYYKPIAVLVCLLSQLLFLNLTFLILFFIQKKIGWHKALILLPFLWSFIEWLTQPLPHNLQVLHLGYTQANMLYFNQIADFSGLWGLSFWVMMLNVLFTFCIVYRSRKHIFVLFSWLLVAFSYGLFKIQLSPKSAIGRANTQTKVSLIQTNIDSYQPLDSVILNQTFKQIVTLSDSAVRTQNPDLLILPEATFPLALFEDSSLFQFTKKAIDSWQTSVAIGYSETIDKQNNRYKNKSLVFTPQMATMWDSLKITPEQIKVYEKQYGLPFMETMPYFGDLPSFQNRILVGGKETHVFKYMNFDNEIFNVSLTICWEQTYPQKIASLVNNGAEYIALMNNDAWFGQTPASKFLLNITKIRAIENRRSVARCSNGGISCFIDPFGKVYGKIPWFTPTISTEDVLLVTQKSFYTQHPDAFAYVLFIVFIILFCFFYWQKN
ncbi:MAG: apolipoprotein N-acyltransferase [Spirosomaceae bacterium]|nr:apolipoprotein N-acyltransferase [Spirosomataceae bacterium]